MARSELIYRWILYAAATLLAVVIQSFILNHVSIWGVHPFLPPLFVAIITSLEGRKQSVCYAAIFGLLCDLTIQAVIPCFYTLAFVAITLVSALVAKKVIVPGFVCSIIVSALGLFLMDLLNIAFLTSGDGVVVSSAMSLTGREILVSVIFVLLVHPLLLRVHQKTTSN